MTDAFLVARIPTLAPHFGVGMLGNNNAETQAVPIIGLDNSDLSTTTPSPEFQPTTLGGPGTFTATQPPKLVRTIAGELNIQDYSSIINWELELYDTQPAQVGGLDKEFIFAGRIDDKLCSWAAMEGLLASSSTSSSANYGFGGNGGGEDDSGIIKLVGVFDDEEIGSLLRQGARGNFLPSTIERICESFSPSSSSSGANILAHTYANSFLISADVTHAVNPNFLSSYLEGHAPRLNVGMVISADSNGHMTTDSVSTALLTRVAEKCDSRLQLFMIRNDSRGGGTVGPMLSSKMGVRAIDAGIPQLSMHSIRATTGSLDPGLGVCLFGGFFDNFESVDAEFE
jgi:aminopeptidase I